MPEPAKFPSRVVVKFHDHVELPYENGVERHIKERDVGPWDQLVKQFPGITLTRLFATLNSEQIQEMAGRAASLDRDYRGPNLLSYFAIDCPPEVDPAALAKALTAWRNVQSAYVDGGPVPPPQVNAADDPRWPNQGYLDPAPAGIDAEYAWTVTGGDGAGIRFIDMERGWTLNHEDLAAANITLLSGLNQDFFGHGTSVLGEIAAGDNTIGCVGIAPRSNGRVVSQWRTASNYNTADAIMSAVAALSFGDVLLLEAQTSVAGFAGFLPVEVEPAVFDAIRLGTALGILIVEAGANGSEDLDSFTDAAGQRVLNRADANFRDSGAIMVGAASSTAPHTRLGFSNFGSRIDCYGWGQNIDTTGDGFTGNLTNTYTGSFGGTSGASPIITGAALLIQSIAAASLGFRFSPAQLRSLLSNPASGTASSNPANDRIGVMPNLRAIIDSVLNVAPDVYLRDFVGDTGDPHTGPVSSSPDVFLRPTAVADPQSAFGQGSGTENSDILGAEAEAGQDNFIYVRIRNRGGAATNVTTRTFWAPPATLVTPDLWTFIGDMTIPNVPSGDLLTVSDAITWAAASIPAPGHYCFVALIGTARDPVPDPAAFLNWNNFLRFIRENNNVTWRNFNVVNNVPSVAGAPPNFLVLPFLAPGAPDEARLMQLEVLARLPEGAKLLLEMPDYLAEGLCLLSPEVRINPKRCTVAVPLNPHGRTTFREVAFPAKSRAKLQLLVRIPDDLRKHAYDVIARQLYQKQEVGRITWHLTPRVEKV
jgi:hypothetical protein